MKLKLPISCYLLVFAGFVLQVTGNRMWNDYGWRLIGGLLGIASWSAVLVALCLAYERGHNDAKTNDN